MPHGAIIGITQAGKTFVSRQMGRAFKAKGYEVLALHKPRVPWNQDEVTHQSTNVEVILKLIQKRDFENEQLAEQGVDPEELKGYVVFFELADAEADKYDTRLHRLFSQGRANAHQLYYISQRGQRVHPEIRENCHELFLFNCYNEAAVEWSKEFNDPLLKKATVLPPWHFYHKKDRFTPAKMKILKV